MPLSKDKKQEYNKGYYLKNKTGILKNNKIPEKVNIPGLVMQGNKIVGVESQSNVGILNQIQIPKTPNPEISPTTKLDADGRVIPEYW